MIYTLAFNKIFRELGDKQSATPMESEFSKNVTQIIFKGRMFGNFTYSITDIADYTKEPKCQIYSWHTFQGE